MSLEYCVNCKYGIDGTGQLPICRRDSETELHINSKACSHWIKAHIMPVEPELHKAIGAYRNNYELAEEMQKITPIYYDESKNFWLWKKQERYWKRIDETDILNATRNESGEYVIDSSTRKELITAIQMTGRAREIKPVPRTWINAMDGVIDLETGKHIQATSDYFFTAPIPHRIGLSEDTPTIDKLFASWVPKEKIPLLYEICAYCLYDGYPIHRMFILVGGGRNGKGQFRDLIVKLVGVQNRTASTLEQLINSRFESARLYRKKICTAGEINYALLERTAILKMLSGGDPIPAEFKNKEPFEFVNTAKIIINTNSMPQTADKTDAWYSRCVAIEFPNQYPKGKDIIDTIPEEEYENLLLKCSRILRELFERGEFTGEGSIQDKEREYERLSNPLTQFIQKYCDLDHDYKEAAWRLLERYEKFCSEKKYNKPTSKTEFNKMLKVNYEVEKRNMEDHDGTYHNWVWVSGLKLKDDTNLPVLPILPENHTDPLYRELSENLGKTGKTGKNGNGEHCESVTQVSPISTISGKICGICGEPLNGNSEPFGHGLGEIHPDCKYLSIPVKLAEDIPAFSGRDTIYGPFKAGGTANIPAMLAFSVLIGKKKAVRVTPSGNGNDQQPKKKHLSVLCSTGQHGDNPLGCSGYGCDCECHHKETV